jgi:hypothetical protein
VFNSVLPLHRHTHTALASLLTLHLTLSNSIFLPCSLTGRLIHKTNLCHLFSKNQSFQSASYHGGQHSRCIGTRFNLHHALTLPDML